MGIVMTDHEINAIAGKTREAHRNAKRELAALRANAAELAILAGHLTAALENPLRAVLGDGSPVAEGWHRLTDSLFNKLAADNVRKLIEDIHRVKKTKQTLANRIYELEGEFPDHEDEEEEAPTKSIRIGRVTRRR